MVASLSFDERRQRQIEHDDERTLHLAEREDRLAPRRPNGRLKAIARHAEVQFAATDGAGLLEWVAEEFGYRTAVACSMADAVLPAIVAEHLPWVDTLFLATGYHFAETRGLRDAMQALREAATARLDNVAAQLARSEERLRLIMEGQSASTRLRVVR